MDLKGVDAVLVDRVRGSDDGGVPVGHEGVCSIVESVGAGAVTEALFALFELLEEAEVSRDWDTHAEGEGVC